MDEEAGPHPLSLSVSDYLTPSWSLSPSSSPLTHSEPSDSDREEDEEEEEEDDEDEEEEEEEEEMEEMRGRILRRRKKRKIPAVVSAKKKSAPTSSRGPGRPCSSFSAPPARSNSQPVGAMAPPTTNINNNININIGSSSGTPVSRRQHCLYCGRHYRSLARHLEKHHANQPEVRSAMELAHLRTHSNGNPSPASATHSFAVPQPSAPGPVPSLFARERESPGTRSGAVSFSLSLSPPAQKKAAPVSSSPPTTRRAAPPTAQRVKSPTPPPSSPPRRGRRMKREKLEEQQKVEVERVQEELAPPPTPEPDIDPEEDLDSRRHHMSPLLSSLSSLVTYLRQQQHASFLSLGRSRSAEAWRQLCHASLSLFILYNRHRECEVAKLTIQDYHKRAAPQESSAAGGTTEALLSPFERRVLCHLPRASVMGKRGRVQPLILPPNCESCLDLLLQTSADVGVDPESPYVFSRPYHSPATPLRGTDLLRNLARASGVKNPGAITGTRVRRQVAILTQLLLLEEGQAQGSTTKRLENFLETEYHVTQNCSSISRDAALMGRVGRVVLYGEKEGVLFRGMSLQHICLELDKRGVLKRPWSEAERVAVETHLKRNLADLRVPAKADCERCLELCPLLVSNH
uniref:Si:cabz01080528.1 n=1 Tax=Hippocampus comes TaxID=109280 RepID=A0A3Q2YQ57_HIPCM